MNKILRLSLLSFLMVFCGTAFAQETKIVCADNAITVTDNGFTLEVAPFSFEAFKNAGQTKPTQNANFKDIRLYAKNSLNVSTTASGMTKMVFTISAAGKKRWADVTASVSRLGSRSGSRTVFRLQEALDSNEAIAIEALDRSGKGSVASNVNAWFSYIM